MVIVDVVKCHSNFNRPVNVHNSAVWPMMF